MKKRMALVVLFLVMVVFAACGSKDETGNEGLQEEESGGVQTGEQEEDAKGDKQEQVESPERDFMLEETAIPDTEEQVQNLIASAEDTEVRLEEELQNAQTQTDMNLVSGKMYENWDQILNEIWAVLKEHLGEEEMRMLLEEQRAWIAKKEASTEEAGAEFEGGSIATLAVNQKAAEMTKERVYELAELLTRE